MNRLCFVEGGDECVFICSTESRVNQGSKGSPGDGKKPRHHQTEDNTHNGKESTEGMGGRILCFGRRPLAYVWSFLRRID